jgi:hypothetical protein
MTVLSALFGWAAPNLVCTLFLRCLSVFTDCSLHLLIIFLDLRSWFTWYWAALICRSTLLCSLHHHIVSTIESCFEGCPESMQLSMSAEYLCWFTSCEYRFLPGSHRQEQQFCSFSLDCVYFGQDLRLRAGMKFPHFTQKFMLQFRAKRCSNRFIPSILVTTLSGLNAQKLVPVVLHSIRQADWNLQYILLLFYIVIYC